MCLKLEWAMTAPARDAAAMASTRYVAAGHHLLLAGHVQMRDETMAVEPHSNLLYIRSIPFPSSARGAVAIKHPWRRGSVVAERLSGSGTCWSGPLRSFMFYRSLRIP